MTYMIRLLLFVPLVIVLGVTHILLWTVEGGWRMSWKRLMIWLFGERTDQPPTKWDYK